MNRKSGWKAITGTTDFGVISSKAQLDDPSPEIASHNPYRLAFDLFVDRILNYVGSYHLKLHGDVDALVFAGGIGEKGVQLRRIVAEKLRCIGYRTIERSKNEDANSTDDIVVDISTSTNEHEQGRAKRILVCKTDEQVSLSLILAM